MDNGKLFVDDDDLATTYRVIAAQYLKGDTQIFPLTCVRGRIFRFFVDLDIVAGAAHRSDAACLRYAKLLSNVLSQEGCPDTECLVCTPSPPAGATKSGCHVVWPNVYVDVHLARYLAQLMVERISAEETAVDWAKCFDLLPYGKSKRGDNGALRCLFVAKTSQCTNCTGVTFDAELKAAFPTIHDTTSFRKRLAKHCDVCEGRGKEYSVGVEKLYRPRFRLTNAGDALPVPHTNLLQCTELLLETHLRQPDDASRTWEPPDFDPEADYTKKPKKKAKGRAPKRKAESEFVWEEVEEDDARFAQFMQIVQSLLPELGDEAGVGKLSFETNRNWLQADLSSVRCPLHDTIHHNGGNPKAHWLVVDLSRRKWRLTCKSKKTSTDWSELAAVAAAVTSELVDTDEWKQHCNTDQYCDADWNFLHGQVHEVKIAWFNHFFRLIRPKKSKPFVMNLVYEEGRLKNATPLDVPTLHCSFAGNITEHPSRFNETKGGEVKHHRCPMSVVWMDSPDKITHTEVVYDPWKNTTADPTLPFLNTWVPLLHDRAYEADKDEWKRKMQADEHSDDLKTVLQFVKDVNADGDSTAYKYILDWSAFVVQRREKPKVWLNFYSEFEGGGKGTYVEFLGKILGEDHFVTVTSVTELTQKHNQFLADKLLVQGDELCSFRKGHKDPDFMKGMITNPRMKVEPKNINAYMTDDRRAFIGCTNNRDSLRVGTGNRRYALLQCSERFTVEMCSGAAKTAAREAMYNRVHEAMARCGLEFFAFLMQRDLSAVHLEHQIPKTELLREQESYNLPDAIRFVVDQLLDNTEEEEVPIWPTEPSHRPPKCPVIFHTSSFFISTIELYDAYKTWATIGGQRFPQEYREFVNRFRTDVVQLGIPSNDKHAWDKRTRAGRGFVLPSVTATKKHICDSHYGSKFPELVGA
jgi:hypothetical protein